VVSVTPEQAAQAGAITIGGVVIGVLTFLADPFAVFKGGS
jgi:hypothetical protein